MAISARAAALRDLSRRRRDVVAEMANSLPALGRAPVDAPKPFDDGADAEPDADADDVVAPVPEPEMERRTGVMDRQPARIGPVTMEVLGRKLAQNPPPQAGAPDFGELPPVGDDPRGVMAAPPALRGEFKRLDADMGGADGEPPTDAPAVEAALPEASRRRVISPSESMPAPPVPMPEDGPAPDKRPMMQVAQRLTAQDGDAPAPEAPAEPSLLDRIASLRKKRDTMNQSGWIDRVGSNLFGALTGQKPNYSFAEGLKKDNADALANVGGDMAADAKLASADPKSDVSRRAREFWRANFKSTPIADDASADDIKGMLSFQKQGDATRKVDADVEKKAAETKAIPQKADAYVANVESLGDRRIAQTGIQGSDLDRKTEDSQAKRRLVGAQTATIAADDRQNRLNEAGRNARSMDSISADAAMLKARLDAADAIANNRNASAEKIATARAEASRIRNIDQRAKELGFKLSDPKIAQTYQGLIEFAAQFPEAMDANSSISAPSLTWLEELGSKFDLTRGLLTPEKQRLVRMAENFQSLVRNDRTGAAASLKEDKNFALLMGRGISGDPKALSEAIRMFARAAQTRYSTLEAAAGNEAVAALHAGDVGGHIPSSKGSVFDPLGESEKSAPRDAVETRTLPDGTVVRVRKMPNGTYEEVVE